MPEHQRVPGFKPNADFELLAYGFGTGLKRGTDNKYEAVMFRQVIQGDDFDLVVRTDMTAAKARELAAKLLDYAQLIEMDQDG